VSVKVKRAGRILCGKTTESITNYQLRIGKKRETIDLINYQLLITNYELGEEIEIRTRGNHRLT